MTHVGTCFCGAVRLEVDGEPEAMGYCHCSSCRSWSGGPVNAFSLWNPDKVRVTAGAEHVATFTKTPLSERKYCAKCGGHLMANHPPLGLVDGRSGRDGVHTEAFGYVLAELQSLARAHPDATW